MAEELKEEVLASDLPLSANLHDITVKHFVLDLSCDMAQHMFEGSIVLWCLPSQTSKETGTEKNTKDDSAAVQGLEKTDASVWKSSEISDNLRVCCHTERTVRDEDNVDRRLEMLGRSVDVEADNQASPAPVECVQSSPSVGGCCQVPVKSTHQTETPQRGETNCCVERISDSERTSLARNCCCGCDCCLSCERHLSDSDTVNCLKCSGFSLKTISQGQKTVDEKNTQKRGFCTSFECSSSQNPDFVTLDTKCCCKCSENSNCLVTNVTDTPGCLKSNSECDTGKAGLVQEPEEETITRHSVSKNSSFSECPEALNQTAELSRCSKADTAVTPIATAHEMKEVAPPHVSQSVSSLCPHTNSSISNKNSVSCGEPFKMILDSFKLDIQRVEGIYLQECEKLQFEQHPDTFVQQMINKDGVSASKQHRCQMKFTVKEHCLHVFVEGVDSPHQFPQAVQIWYRTDPTGPSLKWTKDQDDQPCVFTPGHFLSNRSLLPSQDFPTALPTCEASITVDAGLTVLLTGDLDPAVSLTDDGRRKFSFFTHFPMPSSTFAIAVGSWEMETLQYGSLLEDVLYKDVHKPPIRLFFPRRLKEKSLSVLGDYLPRCMVEVQRMLGTYPFHRLEVLLVPACFDSLGMASPSLLFLSQSTLGGGGSMCVRVAHELCHTWFGLVMGPQDWTEEWMTEGFCTYLEDVLHAQVTQLGESTEDYLGLRAELHLRVLKAELDNTDENLQSLRPNKGKEALQPSGEETTFLKNGMNAEKKFMQVHYLKGYFLLHALEREVGREPFLSFLRDYVHRYLYQLVTSQEFLQMFFSTFTDLKHISVESINADWLDCPGMPKKPMYMYGVDKEKGVTDKENALSMQIQHQLASIVKICRRPQRKRRHSGQMRRNQQIPELGQMLTPQVVVLLDRLLDEKLVPGHVLDLLRSSYHLHLENPEVCHRWCELVIKHRHKKWHCDVQHFLIQHQAMGVYLYGEASISQCPDVVHLARSCFRQLQHDMPESVRDTVSTMLYGT